MKSVWDFLKKTAIGWTILILIVISINTHLPSKLLSWLKTMISHMDGISVFIVVVFIILIILGLSKKGNK